MKYLPFFVTAVVVIAGVLVGDWVIRTRLAASPAPAPAALATNAPQPPSAPNFPANRPPFSPPAQQQAKEWQAFMQAREQVLHDNPDLAAQYQQLRAEMAQQESDMKAAMIKADPTVAPLIARLDLMRQGSRLPAPGAPTGGVPK